MNLSGNKTWFTSDNHYYHKNIIKYSNRPFKDVDDMQYQLIKKWCETVQDGDTVFHLGDFAFTKEDKLIPLLYQLKADRINLHMILGNHDKNLIRNKRQLLESGLIKEIVSYKEIYVDNQFICLFHYGTRTWNKAHHGSWLLFGHSHGTLKPLGKSVDVGFDSPHVLGAAKYAPYSFHEIKKFMDKQEIYSEDYHGKD